VTKGSIWSLTHLLWDGPVMVHKKFDVDAIAFPFLPLLAMYTVGAALLVLCGLLGITLFCFNIMEEKGNRGFQRPEILRNPLIAIGSY
jgi:hypothetical protein